MTRLSALVALCVVMLAASLTPSPSVAQFETLASRSDANFDVNGSNNAKFPGVAGTADQVVVTANPNTDAVAWQKQDKATSFPGGIGLGDAAGQADYANAAVASNRFNNTFHAVWIDQDADRISYRNKGLTGDWNGARTVVGGGGFRVFAAVGVSQEQRIFVAWSEDSRIRYRHSGDNGVSWSGTQTVGSITPLARPFIAGGAGNRAILVIGSGDGNIHAGIWNGSSFAMARITNKGSDQYFSNPTATITPDGTYYVAWRDGSRGVFYSERQSDGSWPVSRVAGGPIVEAVPIASDENGNISLMWTGTASGSNDMYYAFKPTGQPFGDIVRVPGPGGLLANMSGSATLSDRAYGHGVVENFTGGGLRSRYYLFSSDATGVCGGTITFANNADLINTRVIRGTITPSSGCTPTQFRIGLNTQDETVATVQPYVSSFELGVPANIALQCTHTINVRLIQNGNAGSWITKAIKVDPNDAPSPVTAAVTLENVGITKALPKDIAANGPSDGDPNYTRVAQANLRIRDTGDCSGLNIFTGAGISNRAISSTDYVEKQIPLPGGATAGFPDVGVNEVPITIVDKAGNQQIFRPTIIFDPSDTDPNTAGDNGAGRPQWQAGSTLTPSNSTDAQQSIIRTLSFGAVKVTDNLYDPDGVLDNNTDDFWGVWIASEYLGAPGATPPAENPNNPALSWIPLEVSSRTCTTGGCSFTVPVNLFDGLGFGPDLTKAGSFRVYVRVLDGAGNASARAETITFTLAEGYRLPGALLNIISR